VIVGVRRASPQAVDPSAKTGAHLAHVLAVREARGGAYEALLLLDDAGFVTEGRPPTCSRSSPDGSAPPLAAGILEGVTRAVVLRLAHAEGLPVDEVPQRPEDLERADELFITSTVREILPVTRLGDRPVGSGRPGPLTYRLHQAFRRIAGGPVGLRVQR
jgi:branched-chain amino acid aminotransferase